MYSHTHFAPWPQLSSKVRSMDCDCHSPSPNPLPPHTPLALLLCNRPTTTGPKPGGNFCCPATVHLTSTCPWKATKLSSKKYVEVEWMPECIFFSCTRDLFIELELKFLSLALVSVDENKYVGCPLWPYLVNQVFYCWWYSGHRGQAKDISSFNFDVPIENSLNISSLNWWVDIKFHLWTPNPNQFAVNKTSQLITRNCWGAIRYMSMDRNR